jgi:hypothetical protein
MGNQLTVPKGRDTSGTLQFILQEMFRRTDLADIYSLADPERCKRYIIVATDALEALFLKMNLEPKESPDGTLYIQSIEGLVRSIPPEQRAKQRKNCEKLAFFFIRIFQIFGAVFLSMYDSRLPSTDPGFQDLRGYKGKQGIPFVQPGDFFGLGEKPKSKGVFGFGQSGGRLNERRHASYYIRDGPYTILNYHLNVPSSSITDTTTPMKFDNSNLSLLQSSLYDFDKAGLRTVKNAPEPIIGYRYNYNGNMLSIIAKLKVENKDLGEYEVSLSDFSPTGQGWPVKKIEINVSSAKLIENKISTNMAPQSEGSNNYRRGSDLKDILTSMFDKAIQSILGIPSVSVIKILKKFNYISNNTENTQKISGTHAYIQGKGENEYKSKVNIIFNDTINVNKKKKDVKLVIQAQLEITKVEKVKNTNLVTPYIYKVKLFFDNSRVIPTEYDYIINEYKSRDDISKLFKSDSENTAPLSDKSMTIPEYIESIYSNIIKRIDKEYDFGTDDFKRTREGLVKPYNSSGIREELKIKNLWEAMAKDPPVKAHCVARAVQLLSINTINTGMTKDAFTSVCNLKFPYSRDGSLPTPGKTIISSSGLYALSLLFFDALENSVPKILDQEEYQNYLKSLSYLFEQYDELEGVNGVQQISEIKGTIPQFCQGKSTDEPMPISPGLATNLRSITNNLIQQQYNHLQKAMTLIYNLFDQTSIERDRTLKFSQQILQGGMPEINRIADETRKLLLEYYKGCELTYREGLVMIYHDTKSNNEPVAATANNAANNT